MVPCTHCGMQKAPRGRSVPMLAWDEWCHTEGRGYWEPPSPGTLWPEELYDAPPAPDVDE